MYGKFGGLLPVIEDLHQIFAAKVALFAMH